MSLKFTYNLLEDNPERITLFRESPTYKLKFYFLCITLIFSLFVITTIVGSWICHALWKNIIDRIITNNTTNTLQSAVIAITILYVIIEILLIISFGYYVCRYYKLKEILNNFNLNNSYNN